MFCLILIILPKELSGTPWRPKDEVKGYVLSRHSRLLPDRRYLESQSCGIDEGNMCLSQCGVNTQTCYDRAASFQNGPFKLTAVYPQCTTSCGAHGIGIYYCGTDPTCDEDVARADVKMETLKRLAPGAPILLASCSGGLISASALRKHDSVSEVFLLDHRGRNALVKLLRKEGGL